MINGELIVDNFAGGGGAAITAHENKIERIVLLSDAQKQEREREEANNGRNNITPLPPRLLQRVRLSRRQARRLLKRGLPDMRI